MDEELIRKTAFFHTDNPLVYIKPPLYKPKLPSLLGGPSPFDRPRDPHITSDKHHLAGLRDFEASAWTSRQTSPPKLWQHGPLPEPVYPPQSMDYGFGDEFGSYRQVSAIWEDQRGNTV